MLFTHGINLEVKEQSCFKRQQLESSPLLGRQWSAVVNDMAAKPNGCVLDLSPCVFALWPWANDLTSLSISFLICKIGIVMVSAPLSGIIKWGVHIKAFGMKCCIQQAPNHWKQTEQQQEKAVAQDPSAEGTAWQWKRRCSTCKLFGIRMDYLVFPSPNPTCEITTESSLPPRMSLSRFLLVLVFIFSVFVAWR